LEFETHNNLTIEGNDAEIVGHDLANLFVFNNCTNITIRNLTIDWNPLPFTEGRIVAVEDDHFDMEVTGPHTARVGLGVDAILGYDPKARRLSRRYIDHYQKGFKKGTELVSPEVMRVFLGFHDRFRDGDDAAGILPPVGTWVNIRHPAYGPGAFSFSQCTKVQVENITIYCSPGFGLHGYGSEDIVLKKLKVMPKPGSGRWMSTTVDATHFSGCRGTLIMEDCIFEGMGDDATNIHGGYGVVAEQLDEKTLSLRRIGTMPQIGDRLELGSGDNPLVPYTTATVSSVKADKNTRGAVVQFSEALPEQTGEGDIVGNASTCPVVRIRRCTVYRNRARGFLIKTRDVIIENCTFQSTSSAALNINSDINVWWESIGTRDVVVRNNQFIDCKFESSYHDALIDIFAELPGGQQASAGVHRRITIENNIIRNTGGTAIKVGSADGVVIHNNIFDNPGDEAVFVHNSRNIQITGNKLTNSKLGLKIGDGCEPATIKVENNTGF